jgi:hypothetical protein
MDGPVKKEPSRQHSEPQPSGNELLKLFEPHATRQMAGQHLPPFPAPPWLFTAPSWVVPAVSFGIGVGVFAITVAVELWLFWRGSSSLVMMISSDVIAGLLAGLLNYATVRAVRRRRAMVLHRLKVIAAMNHHVRNALDMMLMSSALREQESAKTISQCTTRITWALEEILGKEPVEE